MAILQKTAAIKSGKNQVKTMDNQLIDEALSSYNYLRIYACKAVTFSGDRVLLHCLVIRAFYRYERRKLAKNSHKFNPSRTPTRSTDCGVM